MEDSRENLFLEFDQSGVKPAYDCYKKYRFVLTLLLPSRMRKAIQDLMRTEKLN